MQKNARLVPFGIVEGIGMVGILLFVFVRKML